MVLPIFDAESASKIDRTAEAWISPIDYWANPLLILAHLRLKSARKARILAAVPSPIPLVFSDGMSALGNLLSEHSLKI